MRDLFSFRLTELAYRRAGLKQPADVKLKAEGWFLWLLGAIGLVFVVWNSTIYMTPRGMRRWSKQEDLLWAYSLRIVRMFERGERRRGMWNVLRGPSFPRV